MRVKNIYGCRIIKSENLCSMYAQKPTLWERIYYRAVSEIKLNFIPVLIVGSCCYVKPELIYFVIMCNIVGFSIVFFHRIFDGR